MFRGWIQAAGCAFLSQRNGGDVFIPALSVILPSKDDKNYISRTRVLDM